MHLIQRKFQTMILSMTVCILLIILLFVWRDFHNKTNNKIFYDYHMASILHAESIHAAYLNLRPMPGMETVTRANISDPKSFISNAHVEFARIMEHSQSLIALHQTHDNPALTDVVQRLKLSLNELQALEKRHESDSLNFALALVNEDSNIEIISQQLARLHQIAMKNMQVELEQTQPYIRLAEFLLLTILIFGTFAVWRHNLRIIRHTLTQEKNTVSVLEENSKRLNEAQHIAQVGNWELNLLDDKLYWSDEIYRIFELSPAQFAASYESFLDLIHPDDREMVNKAYNDSLKARHPYNIVHRLLMSDGRIKYVRERGETIYDENGNPVRSLGTVQDITYLHQIEKELKTADERMHLVLKATHDGIWDWNPQTHEDYLSPRWKEIVGYRDEELPNTEASFFDLIHPDDEQTVKEAIDRHLENKEPFCVEMRLRHKDGSYRWILSRGEAIWDFDGKPVRMVGAITDITDLKKAYDELRLLNNELEFRVQQRTAQMEAARDEAERASQAKSEFLSRMSHELRTPMNAILGFSQLLEIEELPSEVQGYVHEIHRAGDYLLELINELLDLSRIETGKMSVFLQPINVDHAVKTAVEIVYQQMGEKGIRFSLDCQSELSVMADSTRLRQILINLLSNAVKYNVPNGAIKVTCHAREDGFLRISVIDTGPGIALEHQVNLFVPFERLGAEHSAVEGTGIGLALSKQLAELMGGRLGFESMIHEGKGALFWLDLPIATRAIKIEVNQDRNKDTVTDEQQIIILYIEDNSANLRVVEGMFRRKPHFKLIAATSGEEGLMLAQRFNPRVILLDIHLPGMGGYAVLQELRRNPETREIPVVALSADAMDIDVKRGLEAGFKYYLTKPIKMNALFNTIERCLDEL